MRGGEGPAKRTPPLSKRSRRHAGGGLLSLGVSLSKGPRPASSGLQRSLQRSDRSRIDERNTPGLPRGTNPRCAALRVAGGDALGAANSASTAAGPLRARDWRKQRCVLHNTTRELSAASAPPPASGRKHERWAPPSGGSGALRLGGGTASAPRGRAGLWFRALGPSGPFSYLL